MKRSAYYVRVSTARQEKEATKESQIAEVEERAKKDGNIILPEQKFVDNGWSGDVLARPASDAMRDSAERKEFEVLYIWDRDRIARRYSYQELIIDELEELGIEVVDLHTEKPKNNEDKILIGVKGLFAEYERAKIAERMRRGKMYKTRSGKLLGYNPPYGYDYIPKTKEQNGYFVINKDEAEVVKKIFDWVGNQGYSIREVIKKLYDLKIYPKKKKREFWTKSPVARLLQNETYIGKHFYYKTEAIVPKNPKKQNGLNGNYKKVKNCSRKMRPREEWIPYQCPAIIDEEVFIKVQNQLKLNYKYAKRNRKNNYLLAGGLIKCTCGKTRVGERGGKHLYYRCSNRIYNYPLPPTCREKGINADVLDNLVWNKVLKLITNKELLEKQAERWLRSKQFSNIVENEQVNAIDERLEKLKEEESRYLQVFGKGLSSFEVYEKQIKDLNNRREALQIEKQEQKQTTKQVNFLANLNIADMCEKAVQTIKEFGLADKQTLLRKIINKIVANQKLAVVTGYIPLEREGLNVSLQPIGWHRRAAQC